MNNEEKSNDGIAMNNILHPGARPDKYLYLQAELRHCLNKLHQRDDLQTECDWNEFVVPLLEEAERRGAAKERKRIRKIVLELQDSPNIYTEGMTPIEKMKMLGPYVIALSDLLKKINKE